MIKIFIPQNKGRIKTNVRGFWYSQNTKKIYYDYIKLAIPRDKRKDFKLTEFLNTVKYIKETRKQESIFFIKDNKGFIFYNENTIERLFKRIYKEVKPKNLRAEIKEAIKIYGGVTIYIKEYIQGNKYFKEIFYNREAI